MTFQIAFLTTSSVLKKNDVVPDCVNILLTAFSAFQKVKICLLLIYHVVICAWETNFSFLKSRRSPQTQSEISFFEKQIKSSKNAT